MLVVWVKAITLNSSEHTMVEDYPCHEDFPQVRFNGLHWKEPHGSIQVNNVRGMPCICAYLDGSGQSTCRGLQASDMGGHKAKSGEAGEVDLPMFCLCPQTHLQTSIWYEDWHRRLEANSRASAEVWDLEHRGCWSFEENRKLQGFLCRSRQQGDWQGCLQGCYWSLWCTLPILPLSIYIALTFNQALCINLAHLSLMETYWMTMRSPSTLVTTSCNLINLICQSSVSPAAMSRVHEHGERFFDKADPGVSHALPSPE